MKTIVLAALFALGLGLAGMSGASAATLGGGIDQAAKTNSLIEEAALICRRIEVCRRGPYGHRHCHWERVCRRVW